MLTILRYCTGAGLMFAMLGGFLTRMPTHPGDRQSATPPDLVLGTFDDDYGSSHTITAKEWRHGKTALYRVVRWDSTHQYLIAQNDAKNPSDPNLWSRIDWVPLENMAPFTWAFCMSAYNAKSFEEAEKTTVAKRESPKTGCNGFPFTRMKKQ